MEADVAVMERQISVVSANKLRIHVVYCDVEDFGPRYFELKDELEALFPDQLDITGEGTPEQTSSFEIEIVGGKLLHSKNNGDGHVDTPERKQAIADGIKEALAQASSPSDHKTSSSGGSLTEILAQKRNYSRSVSIDKLRLHITYCDVEGFAPRYFDLKEELEGLFPDQLDITGEGTAEQTGSFEVEIVGGKLLHSKNNGDDHVDSAPEKKEAIVNGIKEALEKSVMDAIVVGRNRKTSSTGSTDAVTSRKASFSGSTEAAGRKTSVSNSTDSDAVASGLSTRKISIQAARIMAKLRIHVIYCDVEDYAPKFYELKEELESLFPDQLDITGEGTPELTGSFEVEMGDGKLVHSKNNGDGHVDTPEKKQVILDAIREALEKANNTPEVEPIVARSRKTSENPTMDGIEEIPEVKHSDAALVEAVELKRTLSRSYSRSTSADMTKLRVHVIYCDVEDLGPKFFEFKDELEGIFPDQLDITGEGTPDLTGSFEIEIGGGKILHSKNNGDGLLDTPEKKAAIVEAIRTELENTRVVLSIARRTSSTLDDISEIPGDDSKKPINIVEVLTRKRTISRNYSRSTSTEATKLRLHFTYCDVENFSEHYFALKEELEGLFPDQLDITGDGTPEQTGSFEIEIVGGKTLHSKNNGDGLVDTDEKKQAIVDGIKEALEKSAAVAATRKSSIASSYDGTPSRKTSLNGSMEAIPTPTRKISLTSARIMSKLRVHIIYCDVEDYAPKFFELKEELEALFPDQLDITDEGTPELTGCFEVEIGGGRSLHSKNNGDGLVDTPEKKQKIIDGIKEALEKSHSLEHYIQSGTSTPTYHSIIHHQSKQTSLEGINEDPNKPSTLIETVRRKRTLSRGYSRSFSTEMAKLRLHITYCGVEEYEAIYFKLKEELESTFHEQLDITGEGTPEQTGCFEVEIVGGKLLHSKNNGDGLVDTPEAKQKIIDGIREALVASTVAAATRKSSISGSTDGVSITTPRKNSLTSSMEALVNLIRRSSLSSSNDGVSGRKSSLTGSNEAVSNESASTRKISAQAARILSKLRVHVIYCEVEDLGPKYYELKDELEALFPDQLDITDETTPEQTGCFEVEIGGGKLLHSKNNGDGLIDTPEKKQRIIDGIKEAIENAPSRKISMSSGN